MKKIKEYILKIIINEDDDEIIHISERYDCDEAPDIIRFEIGGNLIEAPEELQKYLQKIDFVDILGLA